MKQCHERAKKLGNTYFAVQANKQCFTSKNAGQTYQIYGITTGCKNERGGEWKMNVYKITNLGKYLGIYIDIWCYNHFFIFRVVYTHATVESKADVEKDGE